MPDLVVDWGEIGGGSYGVFVPSVEPGEVSATIDTGGVAVDLSIISQDSGSNVFTFNAPGYVGAGETFDVSSWLKLRGIGREVDPGDPTPTQTAILDFRATDTALYTDSVTDVSFRINDIDQGPLGDLNRDGAGFDDIVIVRAFDIDGNPVDVTLTAEPGSSVDISGDTASAGSDTPTGFTDGSSSIRVDIPGPLSRIEIAQQNDGVSLQAVTISDVLFTTVDVDDGDNTDPDAVDDTFAVAVDETDPDPIRVLDNDDDADGDTLTIDSLGTPANGTVVDNGDGTVTYTPNPGFEGVDTFDYTVSDGNGGTDTATVTVTVGDPDNTAPVAVDDTASVPVDAVDPDPIRLLDNDDDADGDTLTIESLGTPANGTVVDNGDGTVTYTPNPGFEGVDTFDYTVSDGNGGTDTATVTVTVGDPDNRDPDAVDDVGGTGVGTPITFDPRGNDSDPDGDPLTVTSVDTPANGTAVLNGDGTITYTPDPGFEGVDSFDYTISDGNGGTDTATVRLLVNDTFGPGGPGLIDDDIFPIGDSTLPGITQDDDPLNGFDEDPDPADNLDDTVGTGGADTISTGDDADTIDGGGGDDLIQPGIDNDSVLGGAGNDTINDSQGADTIDGGDGDDVILAGVDVFSDYVGDDANLPFLGFDSDPNTEDGRDSILGGAGNDNIVTGDDRDTIDGGTGDDTINAGIDDDLVSGGAGADSLIGSHGSDTIDGGDGDDFIDGSNLVALEITDDTDAVPENDRDSLLGGAGNDTIIGGDDDDTLIGGDGDDLLDGGIDEDVLEGGAGADTLLGGAGGDTLTGGTGVDSIDGGADRDTIIVSSPELGIDDVVDGGSEGDDFDRLVLTGLGTRGETWRIVDAREDSNGNGIDGTVEFLDGTGAVTGTMDFFEIEEIVPCFTPGTLIATPEGERLVEDLRVGDRVITRDNGIQEIRWVGRKDLTGFDLARKPHLNPVMIRKGALGNNLPEHDMLVSPNHRVLVANDKTALYFEEREVLVAAKHLTGLDGVEEVERMGVSYIHIMFDQHEVVLSNGAWTESFQPGDYSLKGIGNAQRQEILELFPELAEAEGVRAYASARRSLKKHEAALLTQS